MDNNKGHLTHQSRLSILWIQGLLHPILPIPLQGNPPTPTSLSILETRGLGCCLYSRRYQRHDDGSHLCGCAAVEAPWKARNSPWHGHPLPGQQALLSIAVIFSKDEAEFNVYSSKIKNHSLAGGYSRSKYAHREIQTTRLMSRSNCPI